MTDKGLLFLHSFSKYLLSAYYAPGTSYVLGMQQQMMWTKTPALAAEGADNDS